MRYSQRATNGVMPAPQVLKGRAIVDSAPEIQLIQVHSPSVEYGIYRAAANRGRRSREHLLSLGDSIAAADRRKQKRGLPHYLNQQIQEFLFYCG